MADVTFSRAIVFITSYWALTFFLLTGVQLLLAYVSITIAARFGDDQFLWSDSANWDAISAGITLLLATYLPVELTKHADCLTAFALVAENIRALQKRQKFLVEDNDVARSSFITELRGLKERILKAPMDMREIRGSMSRAYNMLKQTDDNNMLYYSNLKDSLVALKGRRDYDVPIMYQSVLVAVTVFYYGCILPSVRSQDGRGLYAMLDTGFVGGMNNLILAVGFRAASMFRRTDTGDFKRARLIFQDPDRLEQINTLPSFVPHRATTQPKWMMNTAGKRSQLR